MVKEMMEEEKIMLRKKGILFVCLAGIIMLIKSANVEGRDVSFSNDQAVAFEKTSTQVGLNISGNRSEYKATSYVLWVNSGPLFSLIALSNERDHITIGFDKINMTIRKMELPYNLRGRSTELSAQLRADSPESALCTEKEIIEKCLGFLGNLKLQPTSDQRLENVSYYGSGKNGMWSLSWWRYIHDFPTEERWLLNVRDETCAVEKFENTVSSATCDTEIKISKDDAVMKARTHAEMIKKVQCIQANEDVNGYETKDISSEIGMGVKLEIVHPNYNYIKEFRKAHTDYLYGIRNDGSGKPMTDEDLINTRNGLSLVYFIGFKFEPTGPTPGKTALFSVVVWVDARTGDIVGGL